MKVAAIVPAYNEEQGIQAVLDVLSACDGLDEVIVVSDGSTDRTYEIASACPRVRALQLEANVGKGGAMVAGARATDADVIAFIDADLVGLQPRHVERLIEPVIAAEADVAIGVFREGRFLPTLSQKITPQISGQRACRRETFLNVPHITDTRFGVEMALTHYARDHALREVEVIFDGVTHTMKEQKRGLLRGLRDRMAMYGQIIAYLLAAIPRRLLGARHGPAESPEK
jgi:glycosyltransferase involved in cell wall biosynthesis